MGPPSYIRRSVVDRNVVMRRMTALRLTSMRATKMIFKDPTKLRGEFSQLFHSQRPRRGSNILSHVTALHITDCSFIRLYHSKTTVSIHILLRLFPSYVFKYNALRFEEKCHCSARGNSYINQIRIFCVWCPMKFAHSNFVNCFGILKKSHYKPGQALRVP